MTVHIKTPGQLLAAIPSMMGAPVDESLVLIGIGAGGRVCPIARIDMRACLTTDGAQAVARECTGELARADANAVLVAVFSQHPHAAKAAAAVRACLMQSFEVPDTWLVAQGRYRSLECQEDSCCPPAGTPLPPAPVDDALRFSRHSAQDASLHRQRMRPPRDQRRRARDAMTRARRTGQRQGRYWRVQMLNRWREAIDAAHVSLLPSDAQVGHLAAGLLHLWVRDAVVLDMVPGQEATAQAVCADGDDAGVGEALQCIVGTTHAAVPPQENIDALVRVAEHVAWLCPEAAAPAYALIAIMHWWRGDERSASIAVQDAYQAEPGYSLAGLVDYALNARMAPGWMRAA